jgi:hypothetical protein
MTDPSSRQANRKNQRSGITFAARILGFASLLAGLSFMGAQQASTSSPAPAQAQAPASTQPPPPTAVPNTEQPIIRDSADREETIIGHLNAVLRFYHDSEAPIQKVGEPSDLIYGDQAATLATQIAALAFESAKAEAALMAKASTAGRKSCNPPAMQSPSESPN